MNAGFWNNGCSSHVRSRQSSQVVSAQRKNVKISLCVTSRLTNLPNFSSASVTASARRDSTAKRSAHTEPISPEQLPLIRHGGSGVAQVMCYKVSQYDEKRRREDTEMRPGLNSEQRSAPRSAPLLGWWRHCSQALLRCDSDSRSGHVCDVFGLRSSYQIYCMRLSTFCSEVSNSENVKRLCSWYWKE